MSNWGQYFCNVNDNLWSTVVDLDLKERLPDRLRADIIWIWLYINAPRSDGLSSNKEFPILSTIKDALTKRLEEPGALSLKPTTVKSYRRMFPLSRKRLLVA